MKRRGRNRDKNTSDKILKVAGKEFIANGLQKTSMDQVAKMADISKQTLYSRFKNKQDLYTSVVLNKISEYKFEEIKHNLSGDFEKDLLTYARAFLNLMYESKESVDMHRMVICTAREHREIALLFYNVGVVVVTRETEYFLFKCASEKSIGIQPDKVSLYNSYFLNMLLHRWYMSSLMDLQPEIGADELEEHAQNVCKVFNKIIA